MDIKTYSAERIGKTWTEEDHAWISARMKIIDSLVQDVYNLAREARQIPVSVRPQATALEAGDHVVCGGGECRCERVIESFGVSTLNDEFIAHFQGGGQWPVSDLRRAE